MCLPASLKCRVVAGRVGLVDTGSDLQVVGDQDHGAAQGPHLGVLSVHLGRRSRRYQGDPGDIKEIQEISRKSRRCQGDSNRRRDPECVKEMPAVKKIQVSPNLRDVREPLAEHVDGDLVSVLVLPVGRLVPARQ